MYGYDTYSSQSIQVLVCAVHRNLFLYIAALFTNKLFFMKQAKYIYVARNPKDVVVSYFFHCQGFGCYQAPDLKIEELIEPFAYGEVEFGNHCDHVAEWYKARNENNVLFLLYEEMKADLKGNVMKIAKFLGKSEVLLKDDGNLWEEIVDKCSFTSMNKSKDDKWVS